MDTVTVKKDRLLEKMRTNRDNHRGIFEEAMIKYRERAVQELHNRLDEVSAGGPIHLVINLPTPVDYTEQYTDAIERFDWHEGDEIELDAQEFKQYVLDKWGWEAAFAANTRSYTG
jgi:hypothetical protein